MAAQSRRFLVAYLNLENAAPLRLTDGDQEVVLPASALRLLADILTEISQGRAATIVPTRSRICRAVFFNG